MLLIDCSVFLGFCFVVRAIIQAGVPVLLNDPLVVALAAEIGKTPAQVFDLTILPSTVLSFSILVLHSFPTSLPITQCFFKLIYFHSGVLALGRAERLHRHAVSDY
jgi:hypothetical protein